MNNVVVASLQPGHDSLACCLTIVLSFLRTRHACIFQRLAKILGARGPTYLVHLLTVQSCENDSNIVAGHQCLLTV